MDWTQITILTTTQASDAVSEMLMSLGSEGVMIEDKNDVYANQRPEGQWDIIDEQIAVRIGDDVKVTGYYPADAHLPDTLAQVRSEVEALKKTDGLDFGKLEIIISSFGEEDWSESWKKFYKPFRLGEHFVIKPGWTEYTPEDGDKIIEIDPGLAFGTGTHETTGLCVGLIEKYVRPGMSVIDIGTGSGILAIAAKKQGAGRTLATDLDAVAVRVAKENAVLNNEPDIETRCGDLLDVVEESADTVIANIIADVILMLAEPVRQRIKDGGMFICSGIVRERKQEVVDKLVSAGYTVLEALEKGEWCAIAARK